MNYEEIKRHFENHPPPKEVQLTPWANITDTQVFLKSCYSTIRNFSGPVERCPAFWHLRDFYILMKKSQQNPAPAIPEEETAAQENTTQMTASEHNPEKSEADA
ncbi:hypothetical protein [Flavobacterium sp. DG2-3]|uniref:DUF6965 family protein n=1 Tax=Flavobacterium sp. DG2-3 TaxID=3068317 RepID=UPI00273DF187|nr:hypothetical protein [Flavobacterium sp. DG2-3]MDP5200244.1 hypothetical protein [Flavobacterium sp. DG2-3]